ncbi:phosphatidylinositol 3,4,5-trisphosphate 3-phosphatase and dual-specificity protein phosphatase PTEN isoform X2 [Copidosoma floridanum]|uniref:phosphatidylinositol 3,4,5-trisphosphate 3-phosphatase and dual-specificity protein phosphatase PTEN isoform X2 n=1 Tax=Copidosoma floridanum TaxID=29053 RepID=UPI0006C9AB00|nr:phosphatidylinositol 3,4,5-trisphosphate 3-phosphatase and dual-specificity protein phosphatase PTEN isoform X2 [Copidosoma floridanum]
MFCELMGVCFSCRKQSSNRLNNKISEQISATVTPFHVCVEEPRGPDLGLCDTPALRSRSETGPRKRRSREDSEEEREEEEETGAELLQSGTNELKQNQASMANTISNMKITNPIKGLVSKHRKRFTADGFDLDLTYIKENLIAMGFPAEKLESVYRNHIDDVVKLLEFKHKNHYKLYNLCSERSYDSKKFQHRVATYAFDDHNPPSMEMIKPFCEDVHKWLMENEKNVAAVHCKAGKGRTGVMVSCYLLHSKQCETATEALNFYGTKRTTDRKGVTIPSQRRYVNYYATLVQDGLNYQPVTLILREIKLDPVPILNGGQGYRFVIFEAKKKIFSSDTYEVRKGTSTLSIPLRQSVSIKGDIRVDFYTTPKVKRKEKIFHFWFNTFFVSEHVTSEHDNGGPIERTARALSCDGTAMELPMVHAKPRTGSLASLDTLPQLVLTIDKWGLDCAHKDKNHKIFSPDFKVSLYMNRVGNNVLPAVAAPIGRTSEDLPIGLGGQETPSESSEGESSECDTTGDEDGWESVVIRERVDKYAKVLKSDIHRRRPPKPQVLIFR